VIHRVRRHAMRKVDGGFMLTSRAGLVVSLALAALVSWPGAATSQSLGGGAAAPPPPAPAAPEATAPARKACTDCAVVAIAGAGAGAYAGHQVEKRHNKKSHWSVAVKMDDGTRRTLTYSAKPAVNQGERVKLVDGGKRLALLAQ